MDDLTDQQKQALQLEANANANPTIVDDITNANENIQTEEILSQARNIAGYNKGKTQ